MTDKKFEKLLSILKDMKSAVIAFSGGVDSTFLLKAAKQAEIDCMAVTSFSETMPESELRFAKRMAEIIGVRHRIINTSELNNPLFIQNERDRCFYCKDELFLKLIKIANEEGFRFILDGSNADDESDWRPGRKAALKHGVRSPLIEAEFSKSEIREASKKLGLPTWSKPASPCLSSRFPYGIKITSEALKKVELSEDFIKKLGFTDIRVRYNNDTARIEIINDEMERLLNKEIRNAVVKELKKLGFKYITFDLEGLRSGNLNE